MQYCCWMDTNGLKNESQVSTSPKFKVEWTRHKYILDFVLLAIKIVRKISPTVRNK